MATAAPIHKMIIGHPGTHVISLTEEQVLTAVQKQAEADKYYKKEYGPMKPRIYEPATQNKKKLKNKRKQAKQSKRKNRG